MSKSRKHIKRRNTSKKKTFKIEFKNLTLSIKAMDSTCAIKKAYRLRYKLHESAIVNTDYFIGSLKKLIKKITPQTEKQKESLDYNLRRKKELETNYPLINEFRLIY